MKKIYAYDNCDGDKGIIIADSMEEAIALFKEHYPDRNIATNLEQYWSHGCYIEKVDDIPTESKLYTTCEW